MLSCALLPRLARELSENSLRGILFEENSPYLVGAPVPDGVDGQPEEHPGPGQVRGRGAPDEVHRVRGHAAAQPRLGVARHGQGAVGRRRFKEPRHQRLVAASLPETCKEYFQFRNQSIIQHLRVIRGQQGAVEARARGLASLPCRASKHRHK